MRRFDYTYLKTASYDARLTDSIVRIRALKTQTEAKLRQKTPALTDALQTAANQSSAVHSDVFSHNVTKIAGHEPAENAGYQKALAQVSAHYQEMTLSKELMLTLHETLMHDVPGKPAGMFKFEQNYLRGILPDGSATIQFIPTAPKDTPKAVDAICAAYREAMAAGCEALLVIPVFLLDFLGIHPFIDGNGRISRLLGQLLLLQNGYTLGQYISLEAQIAETKDTYYKVLLASSDGWHENNNDDTPFISYFLAILLRSYLLLDRKLDQA